LPGEIWLKRAIVRRALSALIKTFVVDGGVPVKNSSRRLATGWMMYVTKARLSLQNS
jgi:hypothetical protein